MTFVYIVRCNFTAPEHAQEKEAAWNAWYSGPKIQQMLAKPYFRTCQRFRRDTGSGRNYLALWTLTSPEAHRTPEYKSDWGFFEWERNVVDWSRDLFDARHVPDDSFGVKRAGSLRVVSFDHMNADVAEAARASAAKAAPNMMWLPIAGLDRHTPMIGLQPLPAGASPVPQGDFGPDAQQAVYRPISDLYTAAPR